MWEGIYAGWYAFSCYHYQAEWMWLLLQPVAKFPRIWQVWRYVDSLTFWRVLNSLYQQIKTLLLIQTWTEQYWIGAGENIAFMNILCLFNSEKVFFKILIKLGESSVMFHFFSFCSTLSFIIQNIIKGPCAFYPLMLLCHGYSCCIVDAAVSVNSNA